MNPLLLSLRIAVALAALAAVVVVDALHHDRAPWVMFLCVMPLALSVLLPPLGVVGIAPARAPLRDRPGVDQR
ncbi:MAG: hypothetical protein U5R48_01130 [Gammaproteobacteria bacterium]|nr:hypothetical protein [Gammaproteobacteria bacterium]